MRKEPHGSFLFYAGGQMSNNDYGMGLFTQVMQSITKAAMKQTGKNVAKIRSSRKASKLIEQIRLETDDETAQAAAIAYSETESPQAALDAARRHHAVKNPPPIHGSAHWTTIEEAQAAGVAHVGSDYGYNGRIPLGLFTTPEGEVPDTPKRWVFFDDTGHMITFAPTRSGKGFMQIIPTLITYPGSIVCIDPKGENFDLTWRYRASLGQVYRLSPFEEETHAFNPLATIEGFDDARAIAETLFQRTANSEGKFWENIAINLLSAVIFHVSEYAPEDRQTLPEVRRVLTLPLKEFIEFMAGMATSEIYPALANAANSFLEQETKGQASIRQTLDSEMAIWDDPALRRAVSSNDIDFASLKEGTGTVYINIPFDKMESHGAFIRLVLATALKGMTKTLGELPVPVLYILDEFASIGRFETLSKGSSYLAGYGVRLWFFAQNLAQLKDAYPDSYETLLSETMVRTFFGCRDPATCKLIEDMAGTRTVAYESRSSSSSFDKEGGNTSDGVQYSPSPLIAADEVRDILGVKAETEPTRTAFHFIDGVKGVVRTTIVGYTALDQCQHRISPPNS